jgi:hypothetical protein
LKNIAIQTIADYLRLRPFDDTAVTQLEQFLFEEACRLDLEGSGKDEGKDGKNARFFRHRVQAQSVFKRIADLPIYGDKAELAQFEAPHLLAEIDMPEIAPGPKGHPALWA